jgi:hypothetical protein
MRRNGCGRAVLIVSPSGFDSPTVFKRLKSFSYRKTKCRFRLEIVQPAWIDQEI